MSTGCAGVLCAGLYGSASTWAFNVTAELLRGQGEGLVSSIYADDLDPRTAELLLLSERFVIKSHISSASLRALCKIAQLPIVMTIREPCDAVASLMLRFGQDFEGALAAVSQSAARLLALQEHGRPLILRYEDNFAGNGLGIESIADHLGIIVTTQRRNDLRRQFSAETVARRIADLLSEGALSGSDPLLECEAATQWHPFHVGDGRVGKSIEVLSPEQIALIRGATERFCLVHGYAKYDTATDHVSARDPGEAEPLRPAAVAGGGDDLIPPAVACGWAGNGIGDRPEKIIAKSENRHAENCVANLHQPYSAKDRELDFAAFNFGCEPDQAA